VLDRAVVALAVVAPVVVLLLLLDVVFVGAGLGTPREDSGISDSADGSGDSSIRASSIVDIIIIIGLVATVLSVDRRF